MVVHANNPLRSVGCCFKLTPRLRYVKVPVAIEGQSGAYELRLQQMWQGDDGSEDWKYIEEVEYLSSL